MRRMFTGLATLISAAGNWIGMVLVAIMVVHVTAEVLARALFSYPIPATIEIVTYYYMLAVAFVPLGYVQLRKEHIEAEAIANVVPRRAQRLAARIGLAISICVAAGLAYGSTLTALRQTRFRSSVWTAVGEIPTWPGRWMLPLGFGALALVMLVQLLTPDDDDPAAGPVDRTDGA